MFLSLMNDFLKLAAGRAPNDASFLPRLADVEPSCRLIARAFERRRFAGAVDVPLEPAVGEGAGA
jgi:hypothetical protein